MKILISDNQLKNIVKNILKESSGEDFYEKHYSDIDRGVFMEIVSADPQTKINDGVIESIGKGGMWLIKLFKDGKLKRYKEDLPKANDYLKVYYKYKNNIKKDIGSFDSLPDLFDSVKDYFAKADSSLKNILISLNESEYKKLYEDEKWIVYQPLTEKAACYIGVNTEWCTTYGQYSLNKRFKDKTKNAFNEYSDDLFIIINKNDENEKYQFHIPTNQYMDKNDEEINLMEFWKDNPELSDFFTPFFERIIKKDGLFKENGLKIRLPDLPPKVLSTFLPEIMKEMNQRIQKFENDGLVGVLGLSGLPFKEIPKHWVNVKGGLYLESTQITSLGNLKSVGGHLFLSKTQVTDLGNLESVGGSLYLQNTQITNLGNLKSVGWNLILRNTQITTLGSLQSVSGGLYLENTPLSEKYTIKELKEMYPKFKRKFIF